MGNNDYFQFGIVSQTTEGENTVFVFIARNLTRVGDPILNIEVKPDFGGVIDLIYESHTATKGTYSNITNTWTVGTLNPGEEATLTITAKATFTDDEAPPVKFINQGIGTKVILNTSREGVLMATTPQQPANIGDKVLLQDNGSCGKISSGKTTSPVTDGDNNKPGLNPGKTDCDIQPGDTIPLYPPGPEGPGNGGTVEPGNTDCIETYSVGQFRGPMDYTFGINGGKYFRASLGDGIWVVPGAEPTFYVDVTVAFESPIDPRDAKPRCWPEGHAFCWTKACLDDQGNLEDERCESGGGPCEAGDTQDCCCIKGCQYFNIYDGLLWHSLCHQKYQFSYPYGGLWVYCHAAGDKTDQGENPGYGTYPTGYTLRDLKTGWSIVNSPDFVLGPNSDIFEQPPDDPGYNYDACNAKYQGQGLSQEEIDQICKESPGNVDTQGWSDCMKRLFKRNPSLSYDEIKQLCDDHSGDWTTCMLEKLHEDPDITQEAAAEACEDDKQSHTLRIEIMNNSGAPILLTSMVFYIGGTATCAWGWPNISLWWSDPKSSIDNLRVCQKSQDEENTAGTIKDRDEGFYNDIPV